MMKWVRPHAFCYSLKLGLNAADSPAFFNWLQHVIYKKATLPETGWLWQGEV